MVGLGATPGGLKPSLTLAGRSPFFCAGCSPPVGRLSWKICECSVSPWARLISASPHSERTQCSWSQTGSFGCSRVISLLVGAFLWHCFLWRTRGILQSSVCLPGPASRPVEGHDLSLATLNLPGTPHPPSEMQRPTWHHPEPTPAFPRPFPGPVGEGRSLPRVWCCAEQGGLVLSRSVSLENGQTSSVRRWGQRQIPGSFSGIPGPTRHQGQTYPIDFLVEGTTSGFWGRLAQEKLLTLQPGVPASFPAGTEQQERERKNESLRLGRRGPAGTRQRGARKPQSQVLWKTTHAL